MNSLNQLGCDFFQLFARTEYSLKAAGYYQIRRNGDLEANWLRFAQDVNDAIVSLIKTDYNIRDAISFLNNYPPKKQVLVQGAIGWKESRASGTCELDITLIYVRRVRNNLFHGGKFNGRWFEPQRSESLIHYSSIILLACIEQIASVREAYNQAE